MWPHRIAAPGVGWSVGAVLALLVCAGCAAPDAEPGVPPTSDTVGPRDIEGTWTGDWGRLYLWTDVLGTTKGIYSIYVGTVQGTMADGVFSGWWCELNDTDEFCAGPRTWRASPRSTSG